MQTFGGKIRAPSSGAGSLQHHCVRSRFSHIAPPRRVSHRAAVLTVPSTYGYVVSSVGVSGLMLLWMSIEVAKARKLAGVKYPEMYAAEKTEEAAKFNCSVRGHLNTLEQYPIFLGCVLCMGLTRHLVAAVAALAWVAARVAYFRAYSTGDPGRRHRPSGISFLVLMFMIGSTVYLGAGMAGLVPY